jgi:AICAR transformylase/IMP cyclohydrolase PurH
MGRCFAMLVLCASLLVGCMGSPVKESKVELHMKTGVAKAKELLENYAKGMPIGSEASIFGKIVDEAKETDPAKAEIIKHGFDELLASKSGHKEKAKEILKKL